MIEPNAKSTVVNKLLEKLKTMGNDDTAESGISLTTSPSGDNKECFLDELN